VETQDEAASVVFGGEIRVSELISHRLPLAEAPRAFELAAQARPGVLKVVLDMRAAS
jgi:threonine dehydrogenase-like Zn-dependent dehydrogenase